MADDNKPQKPPNAFLPFILAPVLPALLFELTNFGSLSGVLTLLILFIAWTLILFFAMPLYFIMKNNGRLRPLYIIPIAGLITLIPDLYFEVTRIFSDSEFYYYGHKCLAYIDGVRTECGTRLFFQMITSHFAYGCLAGYIFCAIYFKKLAVWKYRA